MQPLQGRTVKGCFWLQGSEIPVSVVICQKQVLCLKPESQEGVCIQFLSVLHLSQSLMISPGVAVLFVGTF